MAIDHRSEADAVVTAVQDTTEFTHPTNQRTRPKKLRKEKRIGTWERGYLRHVYWVGTRKLGVIKLGPRGQWDGRYRWECVQANFRGAARSLPIARAMVEAVIHAGVYQHDLFDEDELHQAFGKYPSPDAVKTEAAPST